MVTQMKDDVLALLDSDNDGVRTHAIKFTESLIITLSPRTPDSDTPKKHEGDISLDKIPKDHTYIRDGMHRRNAHLHSIFFIPDLYPSPLPSVLVLRHIK